MRSMSMSLPILINISHAREGERERRTEAQIPILVLYVSLKWLILWRYLDTHVEELSVFEFFMALKRALCGADDTPGGLFAILIQRLWEIDYKFVLCRAWNAFTLSRVSCRALRLRGCSGKLWWVSIGRKFCPWDECVGLFPFSWAGVSRFASLAWSHR